METGGWVSGTAVGKDARRDGGRRSRPRKSWRFIGVSWRSSCRTSTPPYGTPSNNPAQLDLEGFSRSSREKPVNTVEDAANSNIGVLKLRILLDSPKRKTEVRRRFTE